MAGPSSQARSEGDKPLNFKRQEAFLPIVTLLLAASLAQSQEPVTAATSKFRGEVEKFAEQPVPAPGGILLVGSSIFKRWTNAAADLAPLPVTNRAFGGSQTSHQLMFFDQVVPPCRPVLVVWYCGSNDVKGGKDPAGILARTAEWIAKVQAALPGAGILMVSMMDSPQKRRDGQSVAVREVNRGLREMAGKKERRLFYVEVNPAFEDGAGAARTDLYLEDGLHLNLDGYRELTRVLRPAIQQHWKPKG